MQAFSCKRFKDSLVAVDCPQLSCHIMRGTSWSSANELIKIIRSDEVKSFLANSRIMWNFVAERALGGGGGGVAFGSVS